jgi:hypothetical protein
MFSVPESKPIFVSADIPSFGNQQMLLHRAVWPVVNRDISVVWIMDSADSGSVTGPATSNNYMTTATDPVVNTTLRAVTIYSYLNSSPSSYTSKFTVQIQEGATIQELKQAILRARSGGVSEVVIRMNDATRRVLWDNELVSEHSYNFHYA